MTDDRVTRRRFLAATAAAAAGTAGCAFGESETVGETETEAPADVERTASTDRAGGDYSSSELPPGRTPADVPESAFTEVYEAVSPSVAQVRVYADAGGAQGSAFLFDDSHVVTNQHVVEGADRVSVRFPNGGWTDATVVGTDVYSDLAVLSVGETPDRATPLELLPADPPVGTEVAAIGNPFGFSGSLTTGVVSGVNRTLQGANGFAIPDAIQTDAPVNPGNSGGPLVALDDRVVGVINSGGGDNIGFAISAPLVSRVVPALVDVGFYRHSYMGVRIQPVGPLLAQANDLADASGVYVASVVEGGPSEGVLQGATGEETVDGREVSVGGDVIRRMGDEPIPSRQALSSYLALRTSPGKTIDVQVVRDGRLETVELTLGARPRP